MNKLLNENKIENVAKRQGYFSVTWRYREDWLRKICDRMLKKGIFNNVIRKGGVDIYKI